MKYKFVFDDLSKKLCGGANHCKMIACHGGDGWRGAG